MPFDQIRQDTINHLLKEQREIGAAITKADEKGLAPTNQQLHRIMDLKTEIIRLEKLQKAPGVSDAR